MAPETTDGSAPKAADKREQPEEPDHVVDPRLIPGGAEPRTPSLQGIAGLDRDTVPNGATDSGFTRYRDTRREDAT